jgi:hypothetical protein
LGERYAQQHGGDDSKPLKRDGPVRRMIARVRILFAHQS